MKTKLFIAGLMVVLVLSLMTCSSTPKNMSVIASIDEFTGQSNISQQVEVAEGGTLTVALGSNPSTGFQWSENAAIGDTVVLKQTSHDYEAPNDSGVVGAAGQEVWKFEALKKGTTTVSMTYDRPWEGGEKGVWTYTLTVTVK